MNLKWLFDLIISLGPNLTEAWPFILHILNDLRAIKAIFDKNPNIKPVFGSDGVGSTEVIDALVKGGISKTEAEDALAGL